MMETDFEWECLEENTFEPEPAHAAGPTLSLEEHLGNLLMETNQQFSFISGKCKHPTWEQGPDPAPILSSVDIHSSSYNNLENNGKGVVCFLYIKTMSIDEYNEKDKEWRKFTDRVET